MSATTSTPIHPVLSNRRSPRSFDATATISNEALVAILEAARWAPSANNFQPWRFHVFVEDGLSSLSSFLGTSYLKITPKELQNDMKLAKLIRRPLLASAVVAVSMKRQKESKILEIEEIEAVACAIQNMHLSCTAYGLGGFWSTPKLIYSSEMNDFLELEEIDKWQM